MASRNQPGGDRLDIAFDARNLPSEENLRQGSKLQSGAQHRRTIDVGIAVNLPVAQELGPFETGNHPQNSRLLPETHVILKTDQVVTGGSKIFLSKLHDGVGSA